jgi:D-alanyl-D-alanine dipeptidase
MNDLVYIEDHGLLGSEYYWNNYEKMNITREELLAIGMTDGRVRVHKDLIPGLVAADNAFREKGMRLYLKEGYRSNELYELAFRKRRERFGEDQTRKLMNIVDRPHASGRAVDVAPWDPQEEKEIWTRNKKDDPAALFIDFYKGKDDPESGRYQEIQEFMIATMLANGFSIGTLREYFHFNFD